MLGHIRSGNLDRFKDAFDDALNGGKGFAMAARDCSKHFMSEFDDGSAGTISDVYHAIYIYMVRGVEHVITCISSILRMEFPRRALKRQRGCRFKFELLQPLT